MVPADKSTRWGSLVSSTATLYRVGTRRRRSSEGGCSLLGEADGNQRRLPGLWPHWQEGEQQVMMPRHVHAEAQVQASSVQGLLPAGPRRGRHGVPGRRLQARQQCGHEAHWGPGQPHFEEVWHFYLELGEQMCPTRLVTRERVLFFFFEGGFLGDQVSLSMPAATCKAAESSRWRGKAASPLHRGPSRCCGGLHRVQHRWVRFTRPKQGTRGQQLIQQELWPWLRGGITMLEEVKRV